jgi:MerR family copper efflux transcriptional regulator
METLLIGQLARRAGLTTHAIRYYESLGLLSPPLRSAAGYRRYPPSAIAELRFVKQAQSLGFSLDEIREILELGRSGRAPCSRVLAIARAHLEELAQRIERLRHLRQQLARAVSKWEAGGVPAACAATFCGLIANAAADRDAPRRRRSVAGEAAAGADARPRGRVPRDAPPRVPGRHTATARRERPDKEEPAGAQKR